MSSYPKLMLIFQDASDPTTLMIPCATHPIFKLSLCSPMELQIIGYQGDTDFLIETFDLSQGSNGRWILHNLSTPRDVSCHSTLLYRQIGIQSTAVDMIIEVENLRSHGKSRKGPASLFHSSAPPPKNNYLKPLITSTQDTSTSIADKLHDSDDTASPVLCPTIIKSESNISDVVALKRKAEELSFSSKKPKRAVSAADSDVEMVDTTAPSSKHAQWPFKYVRPMIDGFRRMETMEHETRGRNGTIEDRFRAAFECGFPGSKKTFFKQRDCWQRASRELVQKYYDADCSKDGLWKNFRKEVLSEWDGRIPGRTHYSRNIKGGSSLVKKQAQQVKVEMENEVIVIDSD